MATFAHVRSSKVLDPRQAATVDAYRALWSAGQLAEWSADTFKQVTDGTLHGAHDNGNGTFTNPPSPSVSQPASMNKDQFEAWFIATFGNAAKTAAEIKAVWPNS